MALFGYNALELYTEDTYEITEEPYFGYLRGRYKKNELKELDDYALSYGIEIIPCIQTLAHLNAIFRWPEYEKINDINDILLLDDERTYELIEHMFKTTNECFRSRRINIGMDEAFKLGLGKYRELHGNVDRIDLMLKHIKKVSSIAKKYNYNCTMWSDMFYRLAYDSYYTEDTHPFNKKLIKNIDKNVELIYWDYYSESAKHFENILNQHKKISKNIWFAGGAWTFLGILPFNEFAIKSTIASVVACKKAKIKNYLLTLWGDNGSECSRLVTLPTILYLAEYSYNQKNNKVIKSKFERLTNIPLNAFLIPEKADKVGNVTNATFTNPSKYMLYNDCFCGIYDTTINLEDGHAYKNIARSLKKYTKNNDFGYIFKYYYDLIKILEYKVLIGIKTRKLYKSNDLEGLQQLALKDYEILINRIKKYEVSFETMWLKENKTFGLEVQQYRLGGLITRITYCKKVLLAYSNKQINSIEELEESLLDVFGNNQEYKKQLAYINCFDKSFTVNNF